MLKINDQEYKLLKSEVKYAKAVRNKLEGYTILVLFDIELNNMKGYVSFYVDFFANKDFKNIVNTEYIEFPNKLDSKISMIEIFDTKNFIDFIDGDVILKFVNIINNKIEMNLIINDDLIKLEYQGMIDIKWLHFDHRGGDGVGVIYVLRNNTTKKPKYRLF